MSDLHRIGLAALVAIVAVSPTWAADPVKLVLKDHRFAPAAVTVPAGERVSIEVENQDPTPAEFESHDLRIEKVIAPRGRITVMVGPLKPGAYKFVDEYHEDTAVGTLTAVAKP
jgi:plastocyanin